MLEFVRSREFNEEKHLRILLHGPVGSGKSSFINSVSSVLQGKILTLASTDATQGGHSFTAEYKSYEVPCRLGSGSSLIFSDVMGIEKNKANGINETDLILALKGHIKEGYEFSPNHPITEDHPLYNKSPTEADRIHVLVSVFAADTVSVLDHETSFILDKLRKVRLEARRLGIPQVAILTKVDKACPEVQKNMKSLYRSKYLKEKVDYLNAWLGLQRNYIFLVKNYESETRTDPDIDAPILFALRQIVSYGEDFLSHKQA